MTRIGRRFLFVGLFLLCLSCSMPLAGPSERDVAVPDPRLFSDAHWGILARSLKDGRVLWAKDEKLYFSPASNLKLLTTAVSLIALGPDYRYRTTVSSRGENRDGVLRGDLIVHASGDPSLSTLFRPRGAVGVFEEWTKVLAEQGIREIQGDIVVDGTIFDSQYMGTGWFWDDEPRAYSAQIGAFSVNDNCLEIRVSANAKVGDPGVVESIPHTRYVTIINRTQTSESDQSSIATSRQAGSNTIILSGIVSSLDSPKTLRVTVHGPSLYGATVFKEVMESRGITVNGKVRVLDHQDPPAPIGRLIVSYESPPLSVIISRINKQSHNLCAELLFRTLGAVYHGEGTTENGARVIRETLERVGIASDDEMRIWDGSGLSRLSMITPLQIVNLLDYMYHHATFPYFYDSLSVAGVDGTLVARMVGTSAADNVRAKTGSSTYISCLSGYAKRRDGEIVAFSLMTNNNPKPWHEIRKLQDSVCEWLSGSNRR